MQVKYLFVIITVLFSLLIPNFTHAQQERPIVRLIYFLPRDRKPHQDIDAKMDTMIKEVQQFYADQMEAHGYGRKTFQFETDRHGNAVIHHIKGKFKDAHYRDQPSKIYTEIDEQFDPSKNIYLIAVDVIDIDMCGKGSGTTHSGVASIVAYGPCFDSDIAAHELGHAFGLQHDFRDSTSTYIMSYNWIRNQISQCAAEWLDVHRAFNTSQAIHNERTIIEMLPPSFASPPNTIRLRFEVNDPDGLHQAQLLIHPRWISGVRFAELRDCKQLNGNLNHTVEFVTSLVAKDGIVSLQVIDGHGNFTRSEGFQIDVISLLPPAKDVSIPDVNLATAIREEIGNSITTRTLLNLTSFDASNRGITDITGLEHAHNLEQLFLGLNDTVANNANAVSNFSPLTGLANLKALYLSNTSLSDASPLAELSQLLHLDLSGTPIRDLSPLAGLTKLTRLELGLTAVSDISALSSLTQLTGLTIFGTSVSDVSPLSALTQLKYLELSENAISDISALSGLTQLRELSLGNNAISDVSALSGLTQLKRLYLSHNAISDVSPLIGLDLPGSSQNWDKTGLYIWDNPLSYTSINTHIPAMQAKGVEVKFDERIPTTFLKISGTAQEGVANTALPLPFVVEVRDERNRALAGVPVTFAITAGGGKLSATTVSTDAAGRAEAHLALGRAAGTTTVSVTAADISQPLQFTATGVLLSASVAIPDAALHAEIASALGKSLSSNLTISDMLKLTTLTANSANIRELIGLQHASNLTTLSLNDNNLSNIAPVAGLSKLTTLSLNNNRISDIAPLVALAHLQTLSLENNNLVDAAPLSGLTQLKTLSLDNNRLRTVSALTRLSELRTLSLNNNDLSDVSPLTSLSRLKTLQLKGNRLSYPSFHTHIPAIQASGATVAIDLRTPTTLVKVSGTHGVADTALPVIVEVQDERGFGFSGVPVTFTVTAGGGRVSASNVITDTTGRARTTLTLGTIPGKNTVRTTAVEVRRPALFTITAINANARVTLSDTHLRAKITETLNKPVGVQLTAGDMLALTKLEAPNANIRDLTGLEHAHNLEVLALSSNKVSDFSPLAGLTQLRTLQLANMNITDVSPLAGLTQLGDLNLSGNQITDVSPLAGLTQLIYLNISWGDNSITDISALAGLTKLRRLYLSGNQITDVSPLAGLTQLRNLNLRYNSITDVSPLVGLKNLTGTQRDGVGLNLGPNLLSYASINTHIPAMQANNIFVLYDQVAHPALLKISGDTQADAAGEALPKPFVVEAMDAQGKPMQGVSVTFVMATGGGRLSATTATTDANGRTQTTLTLGQTPGKHTVKVTATGIQSSVIFTANATEASRLVADVNGDGVVNIQDLVSVSSNFGKTGQNPTDVNGDGIVNISDIVLVAGAFGEGAAAAPTLHLSDLEGLTAADIQQLLTQARQMALTDPAYLRGIAVLEQLLTRLLPKETALLPNYPNPFNPETWIPYQLAKPAEVTLRIYAVNGVLVRTLEFGYQPAGRYQTRSRAAYWDGRNALGEKIASGIYFYTFSAGDFTATRKMLIRK